MLVLPDVLANAGGVVVSYFEWVQGLQEYFWKEAEVNAKLNDIVTRAFEETWRSPRAQRPSMRVAAYGLAVERVAEATVTRGLYPYQLARRRWGSSLYAAHGCHLCERARDWSAARRARVRARRGGHQRRRRARGALPEWLPVVEIDGGGRSSTTSA